MDIEIYDRAHEIMSQRRSKAIAENEMRIQRVNSEIPEIREINDALYNTGRELIRIITEAKGRDVTAKIEQIKQNNLEAQSISRQLLAAHGYPENYLETEYSCPVCGDTGYNGSSFCTCMRVLMSKLTADRLNERSSLRLSGFDSFSLRYYKGSDYEAMERILGYAKTYAANFSMSSESILMFGNTGLGKTHLSLAIANEVLKKGYSVIYDSAMNILKEIEKEHFSREKTSEITDLINDTDLLILDDLGTEYESKFYCSAIYNIINTRLIKEKPTIINTNMDYRSISERYGGKVSSRIATMYTTLAFQGSDVRFQKKLEIPQT